MVVMVVMAIVTGGGDGYGEGADGGLLRDCKCEREGADESEGEGEGMVMVTGTDGGHGDG